MQPVNANEHVKVHLSISIYTWKTGRSIGNGGANQRCLHALATLYFYPLYCACPSSRQREKMSRTDPLCPIAHAACPARQRRMVQFIGSLTLEPAGYHGRAHLQRRLYLVPSMYNISMI